MLLFTQREIKEGTDLESMILFVAYVTCSLAGMGKNKIKAYGYLVLLDSTVTSITSVAYQRSRLLRPFVCK